MKRTLILALLGMVALTACGGGDNDDDPGATGSSDRPEATSETKDFDAFRPKGVTVPLKAGSTAEVTPPDAGKVKMTLKSIKSPADELLAPGLTVGEGSQMWAIEAVVEVSGGSETAVADFVVETTDGNLYGWMGTASPHDLLYNFAQGTTREGFVSFQFPEDEKVARVVASFSSYAGYDIIFEE